MERQVENEMNEKYNTY